MLIAALATNSSPTGPEYYTYGNSYCDTDTDVADCRTYTYACSGSDSFTDCHIRADAVFTA